MPGARNSHNVMFHKLVLQSPALTSEPLTEESVKMSYLELGN